MSIASILALTDFSASADRALERAYRIEVRASQQHVGTLADLIEQAREADLLVVDPLAGHRFGGFWRRAALPQVIAQTPCSVLVVRTARQHGHLDRSAELAAARLCRLRGKPFAGLRPSGGGPAR